MLGPGSENQQILNIMNRVVTWDQSKGLSYEADPRHVEILLQQLKMTDAKPVTTPGTKDEGRNSEDHALKFDDKEAIEYRALVARCKHLAPDSPDIALAAQELARAMSQPTRRDQQRLKRFARYLKGKPRLVSQYHWQPTQTTVRIYSDADWAGCKDTRKSITGGCIKIGERCIKG